jgi:4-methoxybenzoate monooxygenase (O-demethylating)
MTLEERQMGDGATNSSEILQALSAPEVDIDLYSDEVQGNLYPYARKMRELSPVVWIPKYQIYYVTTHRGVKQGISDVESFSSLGGIGLLDNRLMNTRVRKGVLVGSDPPEHTRHRKVFTRIISPAAIRKLTADYESAAERYVGAAIEKGRFDMVNDVIRPFTVEVLADAVGVPKEGREHFLILGEMILTSVGPMNQRFQDALAHVLSAGSMQWSEQMSKRESLSKNGLGADIYAAVDAGDIDSDEAALMVSLFLFGGVDTTITTLANGIKNLLDNPEQWELLKADPTLVKDVFEEALRFNIPVQQSYRSIVRDAVVEGVRVEAGKRIGFSYAAANRDPARFPDPDRFDIQRKAAGHFGFGFGIHACAGQMIARLEGHALYAALVRRISTLELTAEPQRWISGGLASWKTLPVAVKPKAN